jgi:hypothetical protein
MVSRIKTNVFHTKTLAFYTETVYHIATQIARVSKKPSVQQFFPLFCAVGKEIWRFYPMQYHSTRSALPCVDSAQAVILGLAQDGGLYMPEKLKRE